MIPNAVTGRAPGLPQNLPFRQDGFSLLEAIIAVAILGVAAALLIAASRTSVAGQQRSRVYGDAATATKEALEGIQLLSLDSVTRLSDARMAHSQGTAVEVRATARGVRPADVADFNALDTSTLRHVTLRTSFKSKAGATVTKTFSTIVFKP